MGKTLFGSALAGAWLLMASAEGLNKDHGSASLMKNVRSLLGGERELQPADPPVDAKSVIRCFEQCVLQAMTAEECQAYIEELLGGPDLPGHEIPGLGIKINRPRPPDVISATYWMIGIPVNLFGQVDCELHGGNITYPWDWEVSEGVFVSIPETPCIGLDAVECCDKVLANVEDSGIPLVDKNGNCLSCWVHQEPLEPVISNATGEVAYLECSADNGQPCTMYELNRTYVQEVDDSVEVQVASVQDGIDDILSQNPVDCGDFIQLHRDMLLYGRAFPNAMSKIAGLLCGICADPSESYVLTPSMIFTLNWIKMKLDGDINSDENCIIIYTDHQGLVLEPPKIGGSRVGLDFDRDDPDCDDVDDDKPRAPTTPDPPGLAPVTPPTPTCVPPEVLDPLTNACVCPGAPLFMEDPSTGDCVCAVPDAVYDPVLGDCVCAGGAQPDPVTGCGGGNNCPGGLAQDPVTKECLCPNANEVFNTVSGECECEAPYADDGSGGCAACEDSDLTYNPSTGECVCADSGAPPDPLTGCGGGNNCPGGLAQDPITKECLCPIANAVFNTVSGECECEAPYADDGVGGCDACEDSDLTFNSHTGECVCKDTGALPDPLTGCEGSGNNCISPKIFNPATGDCDCPDGYDNILGECVPTTGDCVRPLVSDGAGSCVCPEGSTPDGRGGCLVDCTIQDVIDQYGTDGPCGEPYTDCLEEKCGPFWSPDCLALLHGVSSYQNSANAWMQCLMNDRIDGTPSTGGSSKGKSTSGGDGKSAKTGKSKTASGKTTKSKGTGKSSDSKASDGKSKGKSDGKSKDKSKKRRRVVRHLGKDSKAKSKDGKDSKDSKAKSKDAKDSKAKSKDAKDSKAKSTTKDASTKAKSKATAKSTKAKSKVTAKSAKAKSKVTAKSTKAKSKVTAKSTKAKSKVVSPTSAPPPTPVVHPNPGSNCALLCEDVGQKPLPGPSPSGPPGGSGSGKVGSKTVKSGKGSSTGKSGKGSSTGKSGKGSSTGKSDKGSSTGKSKSKASSKMGGSDGKSGKGKTSSGKAGKA